MLTKGLYNGWVSLIMQLVFTISFNVKVDGEPTQYFQPMRGLKQGDPLSLYLFILMANALSWLIYKATKDGSIRGMKL